jgi:3-hydroxyisobutyrate dehydrogenase and related beta-hydroxyacid dehydrogenases
MKTAFLGLGAMGYPMAGHLKKQFDVVVWNRTGEIAEKHAKQYGTIVAKSIEECADADAILTCVPTSKEVDEVVAVLQPHLKKGTIWVDCTSGDPGTSRETACRLAAGGIEFVDAPVTGGTPGAEAGTLTVMIGGSKANFERAETIVQPFAKKIVHVGAVGAGHAIKALNNTMLAANMWAAAECFLIARKFGLDLKTAFDVINAGSGRSNATENLLPSRILDGKWPLTFKLSLHDKDVRIAAAMAHEGHVSTPILALTSQLFTAALHEMGPQTDYVEVIKYAAKMNGEEW